MSSHYGEARPPASSLPWDQILPCLEAARWTCGKSHPLSTPNHQLILKHEDEAHLITIKREHPLDNSNWFMFSVFYR